MGTKYMVYAWRKIDSAHHDGYEDQLVYQGFSMLRTIVAAITAKRTSGCVRIEWRG